MSTVARTMVEWARDDHRLRHDAYMFHARHCRVCSVGGLCQRGADLLLNADAAGERWRIANERVAERGAGEAR